MEGKVIGPGPYRATKLWNETIKLFRGGMPLRRHWAHFRYYDCTFTGSEAVDYLHDLLRLNDNFGPEVTRYQTLQLLKKFLKAHVIEDIKGRHGTEDFEDNGHLYRFPVRSPLKPFPTRPLLRDCSDLPKLIRWDDYAELPQQENVAPQKPAVMSSAFWNKRHSVAIGDVSECKLVHRKELTPKQVDHIWKSMTVAHLQRVLGLKTLDGVLDSKHVNAKHIVDNVFCVNKSGIVVLQNKAEDIPYWVVSAMKCLANWPNGNETKHSVYPSFERDVLKTVADYFQGLKEPLLTFHLYDVFVNILSLLQDQEVAAEALQVSCLLLPPPNRRHLQLLLRLMTRVCQNPHLPPLNDTITTRTLSASVVLRTLYRTIVVKTELSQKARLLIYQSIYAPILTYGHELDRKNKMVQTFSQCVLGSVDDMDLDELLATRLVTFMMEHHDAIFKVPSKLHFQVEEHLSHLRRVHIKYAGSDTDFSTPPGFCKQIRKVEFEEQEVMGKQRPLQELLDGLIADKELPAKDKKKKLKQFQKSYPEIYNSRFPAEDSKAGVIPEKAPRLKPHLMFFNLKNPLQPFQRSWSFRA